MGCHDHVAEAEKVEPPAAREALATAMRLGPAPGRVLALQRTSGNRAVRRLLARAKWGAEYGDPTARLGQSFETFKSQIGGKGNESFAPELKAASAWGGGTKPVRVWLTIEELEAIIQPEGRDEASKARNKQRLRDYLPFVNNAFVTMGLDTIESQAAFFAHAAESGSFAELSEILVKGRRYSYPEAFKGRGPVQVTFKYGYVQALAYLELRADQLEQQAQSKSDPEKAALLAQAVEAREAVDAIQADSTQAAVGRFAFLFSAAFMHNTRGVKRSAELTGRKTTEFAGAGPEDQWVTGWTESFQAALDAAPTRKKKAERARDDAQRKLDAATTEADRKTATAERDAAITQIAKQEGTMRDAPHLIERAAVKKTIYERAWKTLSDPARKPDPAPAPTTGQAPAAPAAPAATADQAPAPTPTPTATKQPSGLHVDVRVITTSSGPGDDEVYIEATGGGGVHKTPVTSMGDGDQHTFELPAKVVGDGTKPITIKVLDEDSPSADDLLVWMRWDPPFGRFTNRRSFEGSDYRVTLRSD